MAKALTARLKLRAEIQMALADLESSVYIKITTTREATSSQRSAMRARKSTERSTQPTRSSSIQSTFRTVRNGIASYHPATLLLESKHANDKLLEQKLKPWERDYFSNLQANNTRDALQTSVNTSAELYKAQTSMRWQSPSDGFSNEKQFHTA